MDLEQLKRELQKQSISDIVNNYVLAGEPVCLEGNLDLIMKLKKSISNHFDIHVKSIEIVGSSKLGISLNDERLGKPYDTRSDIDVVIVSSELFDIGIPDTLPLIRTMGMRAMRISTPSAVAPAFTSTRPADFASRTLGYQVGA